MPTVHELTVSSYVEAGFFAVVEARAQRKKDGTPYLRGRVRDATGSIDVVAWDNFDSARAALAPGRVVKVRGRVGESYNGNGLELTVEKVRAADPAEYDPAAFLPQSRRTRPELVADLREAIDSLREPVRQVVWAALEPELERFSCFPAAQEIHHAWIGGLLEHSLEVARLGEAIAAALCGLDRDVIVAGALLHDVGKLDAYDVGVTVGPSDDGKLLGHILTGYYRVKIACDAVAAPADLARRLLHIVASHHGRPEFGAAREPMTGEAIVINFADELSAQLMQIQTAVAERPDPSARWTDRVKGLKREVYVTEDHCGSATRSGARA